ncbi:MAG: hypothetical protein CSB16_01595 [Clostridiales bacterium]|nr:MAG: hypothetical protein CSB16_01595 [Clostridiales bacterium]
MNWNENQLKAINLKDKNIIVSASAGSGKTAVLTQRIINLLKDTEIDRFLIVTFTNASARDMREKIERALIKESFNNGFYRSQLKKISFSEITTLHSFCSKIIKEYFYEVGVDPRFNIASDAQNTIIKSEVMDEMLEEEYANPDELFIHLVEFLGDYRSDEGLRKTIDDLNEFLVSKPDREKFISEFKEVYVSKDFWKDKFDRYFESLKLRACAIEEEIISICSTDKVVSFFEEEKQSLMRIHPFSEFNFERMISTSKEEEKDRIKKLRDQVKKIVSDYYLSIEGIRDFDELFNSHLTNFKYLEKIIDLTLEYDSRLMNEKKERGLLTFSDLERYAIEILKNDDITQSYRDRFKYVLVDEYQDINDIQESIITKISGDDNLFMVGDLKQSIYGFRDAKPELFMEKYNRYKNEGNPKSEAIDLNVNYRSTEKVLGAVNHIFEKIMRKNFGGIEYDEDTRLRYGNRSLDNISHDCEYIQISGTNVSREEEVDLLVSKVNSLVNDEGYDYSDIAILMRSPSSYVDLIGESFSKNNIPISIKIKKKYVDSLEIELMMNLLKLIDNFKLDIPLLSALRLPIFGFSEQELFEIRNSHPEEKYFYSAFISERENKNSYFSEKLEKFFTTYHEIKNKSKYLPLNELLLEIYSSFGIEELFEMSSNRQQIYHNIRLLFEKALEFENTLLIGIPAFVDFMSNVKDKNIDLESSKLTDSSSAVKLTSIHASKGLQYKVVILANLNKKYNESDYKSKLLTYSDYIMLNNYNVEDRITKKHLFRKIIEEESKIKNRHEEARLLYVAMTRAEERLVLVTRTKEEIIDNKSKDFTDSELNGINSFNDLVVGCLNFEGGEITDRGFKNIKFSGEKDTFNDKIDSVIVASGKFYKKRDIAFRVEDNLTKSVSEISKKTVYADDEVLSKGIVVHKILEHIDIDKIRLGSNIDSQIDYLEELGVIENFDERELIYNFFSSDIGMRVLSAKNVYREVQFINTLDSKFVKGKIDMIIEEDSGYSIIDYKTDYSLKLIEGYKKQINLYARAVEDNTNWKIKNKYLCFIRLNKTIDV